MSDDVRAIIIGLSIIFSTISIEASILSVIYTRRTQAFWLELRKRKE